MKIRKQTAALTQKDNEVKRQLYLFNPQLYDLGKMIKHQL